MSLTANDWVLLCPAQPTAVHNSNLYCPLDLECLFVPLGKGPLVRAPRKKQKGGDLPSTASPAQLIEAGGSPEAPCFGALDSLSSSFPGFCFEDLVLLPELACPESHQEAWAGDVDLEISEY